MIPVPDGGGGALTTITPEELAHAGQRFADGQRRLDETASALWATLCGLGGMAGGDEAGETFAGRYDPAVAALLKLLQSGIAAFGGISRGLVVSGRNYATAEHHSTARAGVPLPDFADPLVMDSVEFGVPDTAAGGHVDGVNRFLAKFWPQGDDGRLDQAAAAFETAQRSLQSLGDDAQTVVDALLASNVSPALSDFGTFWVQVWAFGGGSMGHATDACGSLASACRQMASSIRDAHHKLEAIGAAVGIVTTAGVLLTIFTVGLSDAAAAGIDAEIAGDAAVVASEFAVEVSAEVEAAIESELVPMLEAAAADLPEIEVAEAELEQTATEMARVEVREPVGARSGGGGGRGGGGGGKPPTGGEPPEEPPPSDPNGRYEGSPKHGSTQRGNIGSEPTDGQGTLDDSVPIKETTTRRVGVDPANDEFVVFDETTDGVFHGHVRAWSELTQQMKNALIRAGRVTSKGKIIR